VGVCVTVVGEPSPITALKLVSAVLGETPTDVQATLNYEGTINRSAENIDRLIDFGRSRVETFLRNGRLAWLGHRSRGYAVGAPLCSSSISLLRK
jgi:hypothetical protein